jgi:hypothetical protein
VLNRRRWSAALRRAAQAIAWSLVRRNNWTLVAAGAWNLPTTAQSVDIISSR